MARAMPSEAEADSLQSRLDTGELFGQAQLLDLLYSLGDELADAHHEGRIHGSLTPADIRFDAAGEAGLDGWGRDVAPDPMKASGYAPIECYAPVHPQGPWTDIYAVAAILWRAITGAPPEEVLHRKGGVTLARLAPSGFDPTFLHGIDAALEIAPQRRPQRIDEWLALFERPTAARSSTPLVPPPATVTVGRRRLVPASIAIAGLAAFWLNAPSDPPPSPPPVAQEPPAPRPAVAPSPAPAVVVELPAPAVVVPPPVAAPAGKVAVFEPVSIAAPAPRRPIARAEAAIPVSAPLPAAPADAEPTPEPIETTGDSPRELLTRADRRLRGLFSDYGWMNSKVERSYTDDDVPYPAKQRAYRESQRLERELTELRDLRNRLARTGNRRTANRRFADFEAIAADLHVRIDEVRRLI